MSSRPWCAVARALPGPFTPLPWLEACTLARVQCPPVTGAADYPGPRPIGGRGAGAGWPSVPGWRGERWPPPPSPTRTPPPPTHSKHLLQLIGAAPPNIIFQIAAIPGLRAGQPASSLLQTKPRWPGRRQRAPEAAPAPPRHSRRPRRVGAVRGTPGEVERPHEGRGEEAGP